MQKLFHRKTSYLFDRFFWVFRLLPELLSRPQACDATRVTLHFGVAPQLDPWSEGHDEDGTEAGLVGHEGGLPGDQGASTGIHVNATGYEPLKR
jgi:hypothetical protein